MIECPSGNTDNGVDSADWGARHSTPEDEIFY